MLNFEQENHYMNLYLLLAMVETRVENILQAPTPKYVELYNMKPLFTILSHLPSMTTYTTYIS